MIGRKKKRKEHRKEKEEQDDIRFLQQDLPKQHLVPWIVSITDCVSLKKKEKQW